MAIFSQDPSKSRKPLDQADLDVEMGFLDHLEALRWHIIRSLIVLVVMAILAFIYKDFVFGTLFMGPARGDFPTYTFLCRMVEKYGLSDELCVKDLNFKLMNTEMSGQFMQHIYISITTGIVVSFPYFCFELWRFLRPALTLRERKATRGIVLAASVLFAIGTFFGYYIITPITIQFLANYQLDVSITNNITISNYVSLVAMTTLSIALVFELPIVVYFLSRGGILTPKLMRTYRRHAIIVILIASAIITPSTDALSLMLVAIPFYGLYEASISVSYIVYRNKMARENKLPVKVDNN